MMELSKVASCLTRVRKAAPIVHCITNFVTVNDCANIVLAAGGSPTMADHIDEVAEIQERADALVLNMGAIENVSAMLLAGEAANRLSHPVVLDPVGASGSALRRASSALLTERIRLTAVRGNASEIRYLASGSGKQAGVDADAADRITRENAPRWGAMALDLSQKLGSIVCISGQIDLVAGLGRVFAFSGGCEEMARITGSGCMLSALLGTFLGACPDRPLEAAVCAQAAMNAAGERALEKTVRAGGGTMTFRLHLIDAVSLMNEETFCRYAKFEELSLRPL